MAWSGRSALALVALLALPPVPALAQEAAPSPDAEPGEPPVARAREAFRLGSDLAKQGQWADALAAFERAQKLFPHASTLHNIGFCERALGRLTRARRALERARERELSAGEPELTAAQRQALDSYLSEIETKLARAAVTVETPGASVAIDGRPLEALTGQGDSRTMLAGTMDPGPAAPVPARSFTVILDPGDHLFMLVSPGGRTEIISERFEAGQVRALVLGSPQEPAGPSAEPPQRQERSRSPSAYVAFGVGGAGLLVAIVSGAVAVSTKLELDSVCASPSECPLDAAVQIDRMRTSANVASVATAIGLANMGLGAGLYFGTQSEQRATVALAPTPAGAGVVLEARSTW